MKESSVLTWSAVAVTYAAALFAIAPAHAADTDSLALEEVVVTAEKRETDLQKTPVVVNVVSGDALRNASVTEIQNLQTVVPNLFIRRVGARVDFSIRGVAAQIISGADQPSTAVLVDGIYTQASAAGLGSLLDIDQVEVLKGPQGTLFGRNATAGAISIKSKNPEFTTTGRVDADIGNYSRANASAVFNMPLNDQWAIRAAFGSNNRDGYFADGYEDEKVYSGRLKLFYKPSDDFSLLLSGNYAHQDGAGSAYVLVNRFTGQPYATDPWAGPTNAAYQSVLPAFRGWWGYGGSFNQKSYGFTSQLDWKLNPGTLTVLGGHQVAVRDDVQQNFQATYNPVTEDSWEARFASNDPDSRLKWLGGLYFYNQDLYTDNYGAISSINAGAVPPFIVSARGGQVDLGDFPSVTFTNGLRQRTTSYAAFTQETFAITEAVRLTAGARWQHEAIRRGGAQTIRYTNGILTPPVTLSPFVKGEWGVWTWKGGIDFDLGENSMGYASVSTGWKAGKPNTLLPPYDKQAPEKMTAYTLGIKNRFFNERLQLNGELFYWDYQDRQVAINKSPVFNLDGTQALSPTGTTIVSVQSNAPKSHIQGIDLDIAYLLTAADRISMNVEYLDEALFDDLGGQTLASCPAAKDCQANDAPKWSGTFSYRHTQDFGRAGQLAFDYTGKYQTKVLLDLNGASGETAGYWQKAYSMSSAGLAYQPESSSWSIRVYVNNLEDKLIKASAARETAGVGPTAVAYYRTTFLPPRTYGIQLRAAF